MHKLKKFTKAMALALALTLAVPAGLPASTSVVAEAATVKFSATKKSLKKGKSFTLKVKGTKKKVTWSSSKKSVATVNKNGKVTAKKAGTATITAKVGGKSYKCKVTVTDTNKYVAKAPFEAKEAKFGNYTAAVPKSWLLTETEQSNVAVYLLLPADADMNSGSSNVTVADVETPGATQENFDILFAYLKEAITEESLTETLNAQLGGMASASVQGVSVEEKEISLGKAAVVSYTLEMEASGIKTSVKQTMYYVYANNHLVQVTATDNGTEVTPDINTVTEYLVNSLVYVK